MPGHLPPPSSPAARDLPVEMDAVGVVELPPPGAVPVGLEQLLPLVGLEGVEVGGGEDGDVAAGAVAAHQGEHRVPAQ